MRNRLLAPTGLAALTTALILAGAIWAIPLSTQPAPARAKICPDESQPTASTSSPRSKPQHLV